MTAGDIAYYAGLTGCSLVYLAAILRWSWSRRFSTIVRICVFFAGLIIIFVPFAGEPFLILIRGFSGDFSMGTLLLCFISITSILLGDTGLDETGSVSGGLNERTASRQFLLACVVVLSIVLYPFALGLGPVDTYSWGYGHLGLALGLMFVCLIAWSRQYYLVVIWLLLGVMAYLIGIYESTNLWDYLIDPFLALYAMAYFINKIVAAIPKLKQIPIVRSVAGGVK